MVSPEHGESSSSPSADIYISFARWGTAESAVRLELSDGSSFFVPIDQYDSALFGEGVPVDEELRAQLQRADDYFHIRCKALDLLARREHSAFELKRKLRQRGFSDDQTEEVCREMRNSGYLDDMRFADQFLRSRLGRKPEGRMRMEQRLRSKGLSVETCRTAIEEWYTPDLTRELMESALQVLKRRRGELETEECARELLKKGFLSGEVREFLKNGSF